jgi:PAS domain S-box-containing protein
VPLSTLYGAVAASVWFAGVGPAVVCAALGFLPAIYLFADPAFLAPDAPLRIAHVMLAYLVSAGLIIVVGYAAHRRHKRAEEALRSSERMLNAVLDALPVGVIIADTTGKIVRRNAAHAKLWGLPPGTTSPHRYGQYVAFQPQTGKPVELQDSAMSRALREGEVVEGELVECERFGSKERRLSLNYGAPVRDAQGGIVAAVVAELDVPEPLIAQRGVRANEELLRRVLDNLFAFAGITTLDGTLIEVNRAPLKAAGLTAQEVLGRKLWAGHWTSHSRKVRARLRVAVKRARGGEVVRYDEQVRGPGDSCIWIDFQLAPLRDAEGRITHLVPSAMDITARHQAQAALREREERFRAMADGLPLIVWVHDAAGRQEFVNATFCDYFGVTREEMRDGRWQVLLHPEDGDAYAAEYLACVQERRSFHAEVRVRRADGEWRWIESWAQPRFNAAGEFIGHVGTSADVTERRRAEEALRGVARRKDVFLAMLAHELRNPLAPIRNAVQILRQTHQPALLENAREMIERQVQHLTRLVDDLLDVSRVSQGKVLLRRTTVDVVDVIAEAVELSRPLIAAKGHTLTLTLPPARELWIDGDASRLAQVLGNIINNAAKYTEEGGAITLTAAPERDTVLISVRDNGIGITPQLLPAVFDLFAQGERGLDRAHGGLGIGLALVKSLVELHGGEVAAASDGPERGSVFTVRLPMGKAPVQQPPAVKAPPVGEAKRVLVVDDNLDAAQSMRMLLEHAGHSVAMAHDGRTALSLATQFGPEVCVLDIGLPHMDGFTLAQTLRETPAGHDMVLIALTGYGQEQDRARSKAVGFDHHLVKPVAPDVLLAHIASAASPVPG